jgi:CarboxypepD_reg-like domain
MKYLLFLISTFGYFNSFTQEFKLSLTVVDVNNKPIPYASIVYIHLEAGTISDENGQFSIVKRKENDSIKISAISYSPLIFAVNSLNNNDTIRLKLYHKELAEVIASPLKNNFKTRNLGYYKEKNNALFKLQPGSQIGLFINNEAKVPAIITKLFFKLEKLSNCNYSLRLRILERNEKMMPGKDLLDTNYILKSSELKKKNTINFRDHEIAFPENGVFIVLEWIDLTENCNRPQIPVISGNLSLENNLVYFNYRDRKWQKRPDRPAKGNKYMTPNFGVEISY